MSESVCVWASERKCVCVRGCVSVGVSVCERERVCVCVSVCVYLRACGLVGSEKILPTLLLLLPSFGPDLDPILPRCCIHPVKYLTLEKIPYIPTKRKSPTTTTPTQPGMYLPFSRVGYGGGIDIEGTS